jgi:hypothetical protein
MTGSTNVELVSLARCLGQVDSELVVYGSVRPNEHVLRLLKIVSVGQFTLD